MLGCIRGEYRACDIKIGFPAEDFVPCIEDLDAIGELFE
jgi:hypothetical protein